MYSNVLWRYLYDNYDNITQITNNMYDSSDYKENGVYRIELDQYEDLCAIPQSKTVDYLMSTFLE
jgi:hypothetical protein